MNWIECFRVQTHKEHNVDLTIYRRRTEHLDLRGFYRSRISTAKLNQNYNIRGIYLHNMWWEHTFIKSLFSVNVLMYVWDCHTMINRLVDINSDELLSSVEYALCLHKWNFPKKHCSQCLIAEASLELPLH